MNNDNNKVLNAKSRNNITPKSLTKKIPETKAKKKRQKIVGNHIYVQNSQINKILYNK